MWGAVPEWEGARSSVPKTLSTVSTAHDPGALSFLKALDGKFSPRRRELLAAQARRQTAYDAGVMPGLRSSTRWIRAGNWACRARSPQDLGSELCIVPAHDLPTLNGRAHPGMVADFEDNASPTLDNMVAGQLNVAAWVRDREIDVAFLVRPRGLQLVERHVAAASKPVSATLHDIGVFLYHNASMLVGQGRAPTLLLPKIESLEEAVWFDDVLSHVEGQLGLQRGAVHVVVAIETLPAAFEVHEILFALRHRAVGLHGGLRDYVFSMIKTTWTHADRITPDRSAITLSQPSLCAYRAHLAAVARKRSVIGLGILQARQADYPALERPDEELLRPLNGPRTLSGLHRTVETGVRYLASWLSGQGALRTGSQVHVAADAEFCRAQVWQWIRHEASLEEGAPATAGLLADVLTQVRDDLDGTPAVDEAAQLFLELCTTPNLNPCVTAAAYEHLASGAPS